MPKATNAKAGGGKAKSGAYRQMRDLPLLTLTDILKKEWHLTEKLGRGGFGLVYSARESKTVRESMYAVKIEYEENGPLFTEMHVYLKMAKPNMVQDYLRDRGLQFVGVPRLHAFGSFLHDGEKYRFVVLDRCSQDVQGLLEKAGCLRRETVATLALYVIDALEYVHSRHYVHADVKAANMMFGYAASARRVYLIDYGLAELFESAVSASASATASSKTGNAALYKHRDYVADKRRAHNGTIEFTSRDAHAGYSPSRRGDLEQLGYNLVLWATGTLNWIKETDPERVHTAKRAFFDSETFQLTETVRSRFPEIVTFLRSVRALNYDQAPDYAVFRKPFVDALAKLGIAYPPGRIAELEAPDAGASSSSSTPKHARTAAKNRQVVKPVDDSLDELAVVKESTAHKTKPAKTSQPVPVKITKTKLPKVVTVISDDDDSGSDAENVVTCPKPAKNGAADVTFARQLVRKSISTLRRRSGSSVATRTRARATQRNVALEIANAGVTNDQTETARKHTKTSPGAAKPSKSRQATDKDTGKARSNGAKRGASAPVNGGHLVEGSRGNLKKPKTAKSMLPANSIIPGAVCVPSASRLASNADIN